MYHRNSAGASPGLAASRDLGEADAALLPAQAGHRDRIALGMAAAAGSVVMLSTMNMFAKLVSGQHSVIEVAFYRNVIAVLPFAAAIFIFPRRRIWKINSKPRALVARSIIGTMSLLVTFSAFNYLPMADAQALFFTSTLFIPVLGYFFLHERVGAYRAAAIAAGCAGMLVIVRPAGAVNTAGVSLALTAALLHSCLGILLRLLGRTERPETTAFYFLAIGVGLTALGMPFVATRPTQHDFLCFLGAGTAGALAQLLLSVSFKYAPAALVTTFSYTGIVWAAAYGWFIWGDWPAPAVWLGTAIIIASSLLLVWRERFTARRLRQAGVPSQR